MIVLPPSIFSDTWFERVLGEIRLKLSAVMTPDAENAVLPTARDNLLYTPTSSDGISNNSGATINSASDLLTGSGFVAADVGKVISVYSAGSKFYLSTITVNAGGTGHAINDLLTLGGTFSTAIQVRVIALSGTAITDVDIVNPGIYTVSETALSQASTTGAGTGATFTVTMVRAPLASTITEYISPTQVRLAVAASASVANVAYAYGTDNTAVIQAALTALIPVRLPQGICIHTSTLTMPAKSTLMGLGAGSGETYAGTHNSVLLYLGQSMDNAQVVVSSANGVRLGGLALDGHFLAAQAVKIENSDLGRITELRTHRHTKVAFSMNVTIVDNSVSAWKIDKLDISENVDYGLNTHGIWTGYPNHIDVNGDPNQILFGMVRSRVNETTGKKGIPWQCGTIDHVTIDYARLRGPSNKPGFEALGGNWDVNGNCRQVIFLNLDSGEGGYLGRATGFAANQPSGMNHIYFYDMENGSPVWSLEPGATLRAVEHRGGAVTLGMWPTAIANLPQDPAHAGQLAYITNSPTRSIGETFTVSGSTGSEKVIAAFEGTANTWRVVATVQVAPDFANGLTKVSTAPLEKTSNTTFETIPDLEITLLAGETYSCRGTLSVASGAVGGLKIRVINGGSLTATSSRFSALAWNGTTPVSNTESTALGSLVAANAVFTKVEIEGVIVVNAGGPLRVQAAQNTSDGTPTTVAVNSHFSCTRIS